MEEAERVVEVECGTDGFAFMQTLKDTSPICCLRFRFMRVLGSAGPKNNFKIRFLVRSLGIEESSSITYRMAIRACCESPR